MEQANLALLEQGLQQFGMKASEAALTAIVRHLDMVAEWNRSVNLTAIKDERDMVLKHVVDSAAALALVDLKPGNRLIDVGTGAGFPGVTLKCLVPGIEVVLLESLGKRCKFLEAVGAEVLPLIGAPPESYQVVWSRAEDAGANPQFREQFDVVVARAVAELRVLAEYCLPLCRVGGEFLAMKGPAAQAELESSARAILVLGGEVTEVREVHLPEDAGSRTLIRIKKVRSTARTYPRKAGVPAKTPL
jgi:16S rRNA (guanine527-N7)-methyltransferase